MSLRGGLSRRSFGISYWLSSRKNSFSIAWDACSIVFYRDGYPHAISFWVSAPDVGAEK